jgi:DNA ligase (NAD+)
MNIDGLGEETIELLYSRGLIHNVADLYDLKHEQLASLERLGNKSAANIIEGLAASLAAPYHRKLFALGIRHVGETVAKTIAAGFPDLDALVSATEEQLCSLPEIGPRISSSIREYFADADNLEIIRRLRAAGMSFEGKAAVVTVTGPLAGKTIVVSGTFTTFTREELKAAVEAAGGKNAGSVSGSTSFIVAGSDMGPSKRAKAEELGIPLISEEEFIKMIKE